MVVQRFELCSARAARGWKEETTLLELVVWLDLNEDDKTSYDKAKERLIKALMPMGFIRSSINSTLVEYNLDKRCQCSATTFESCLNM